ncbi:MAG: tRNA threonylcarbamoyladenosine dehydratase [Slackia sp.]|nr:tRNA threonylcarbamoyladenosine dehydratase [Slackia sp.]
MEQAANASVPIASRDERTARLIGCDGVERLKRARVAVFGLGGVGSSCAEALARAGVGTLVLIDRDEVEESNINRQALAFYSTIGRRKAEVMAAMVRDIAPDTHVVAHDAFVTEDRVGEFVDDDVEYIVDAVDTVTTKLALAAYADAHGIAYVGSMGAANKRCPEALRFADIYETQTCPLCRAVRKQARKRGIGRMRVLYSSEQPIAVAAAQGAARRERTELGTLSFMPPIMGQMIAGDVIKSIVGIQ